VVSWWPGDGDAHDIQGGNNGTLENGAAFATGKVGPAFSFDGFDDFVAVPNSPNLNLTQPLTIDAWVNPSIANQNGGIVEKTVGDQVNTQYLMHLEGGVVFFRLIIVPGVDHRTVHSNSAIPINEWTHIVGTWDGATMKLFINGVQQTETVAVTPPINSGNGPTLIGRLGQNIYHFAGLIDEVEIFDRALSTPEIIALYLADSAGKCKNIDQCPDDPNKTAPGACGCGVPDTDADGEELPIAETIVPITSILIRPTLTAMGLAIFAIRARTIQTRSHQASAAAVFPTPIRTMTAAPTVLMRVQTIRTRPRRACAVAATLTQILTMTEPQIAAMPVRTIETRSRPVLWLWCPRYGFGRRRHSTATIIAQLLSIPTSDTNGDGVGDVCCRCNSRWAEFFNWGQWNLATGATIYFWGAQWSQHNPMSGSAAPNSFKGFETGSEQPACGATWASQPGNNSSPPPSVPQYMAVIVSSSIQKNSSVITGNVRKIVIVQTNAGYGPSPGQAGTGKVVSIYCLAGPSASVWEPSLRSSGALESAAALKSLLTPTSKRWSFGS
jgi:hypothetical protein